MPRDPEAERRAEEELERKIPPYRPPISGPPIPAGADQSDPHGYVDEGYVENDDAEHVLTGPEGEDHDQAEGVPS